MSDDIVKRLRSGTDWWRSDCEIRMQAADEIERLRKAEQHILKTLELANKNCHDRNFEIERLRAALSFYADPNNWTEEWDEQFRAWATVMDGGEKARTVLDKHKEMP